MNKSTPEDPKGLIFEAYRIDGIVKSECRTIFLDWALSLPSELDVAATIRMLLARHDTNGGHPMSEVLNEGLQTSGKPKRRGGWRTRERPDPQ